MNPLLGWLLGAALVLPAAGTTSRERGFCGAWLDLSPAERRDVVARAAPPDGEAGSECRSGLGAGVRKKLDAECTNWPKLMDFEVRMIVEGVWSACGDSDEDAESEEKLEPDPKARRDRPRIQWQGGCLGVIGWPGCGQTITMV